MTRKWGNLHLALWEFVSFSVLNAVYLRCFFPYLSHYLLLWFCHMHAGFIWCYWVKPWYFTSFVSRFHFCLLYKSPVWKVPEECPVLKVGFCTKYRYGFGAYFNILPGSEWSALMLTYGFPLAIIGMALKVISLLKLYSFITMYNCE